MANWEMMCWEQGTKCEYCDTCTPEIIRDRFQCTSSAHPTRPRHPPSSSRSSPIPSKQGSSHFQSYPRNDRWRIPGTSYRTDTMVFTDDRSRLTSKENEEMHGHSKNTQQSHHTVQIQWSFSNANIRRKPPQIGQCQAFYTSRCTGRVHTSQSGWWIC